MFSYIWCGLIVVLLYLAGLHVGRETGSVRWAMITGAISGALPTTVVAGLACIQTTARQWPADSDTSTKLAFALGLVLFTLLLIWAAMDLGGLLAALAALVGGAQFREEHPPALESADGDTAYLALDGERAHQPPGGAPWAVGGGGSDIAEPVGGARGADGRHASPAGVLTHVDIRQSVAKTTLMAVLCAAFAFGGWQMLHDPHVQGFERLGMMSCIFVFGLVAPLALARLITAWPLLRATDAGIEYRGVPWPWTHRTVAWEDIAAIGVRTAPSLLLGPYVMVIWTTTTRSPDRFENWQLPRSAKGRLRMLTVRFARQIEQHDVRIIGLNAGRRSSATAARSDAAPSR